MRYFKSTKMLSSLLAASMVLSPASSTIMQIHANGTVENDGNSENLNEVSEEQKQAINELLSSSDLEDSDKRSDIVDKILETIRPEYWLYCWKDNGGLTKTKTSDYTGGHTSIFSQSSDPDKCSITIDPNPRLDQGYVEYHSQNGYDDYTLCLTAYKDENGKWVLDNISFGNRIVYAGPTVTQLNSITLYLKNRDNGQVNSLTVPKVSIDTYWIDVNETSEQLNSSSVTPTQKGVTGLISVKAIVEAAQQKWGADIQFIDYHDLSGSLIPKHYYGLVELNNNDSTEQNISLSFYKLDDGVYRLGADASDTSESNFIVYSLVSGTMPDPEPSEPTTNPSDPEPSRPSNPSKPSKPSKPTNKPSKPAEPANPNVDLTPVESYRLYNPNTGEHFYTNSAAEHDMLVRAGWNTETRTWKLPTKSDYPIYRVYNPNSGDHHYTLNAGEKDFLVGLGWKDEGIAMYSAGEDGQVIYRLYNPNEKVGQHFYTASKAEKDMLVNAGWSDEGTGFYGLE